MSIYLVKMEHPDGPEWAEHVVEHVEYLQTLIASGPLTTGSLRAGFLIFHAQNEQDVRQLVDNDPFAREGLIATLWIEQWDPLFGKLSELSSQKIPEILTQSSH